MARLALLVGIDHYKRRPLTGCIADAKEMEDLLARNEDGGPNFQCMNLTSDNISVTQPRLRQGIEELFSKNHADIALFYFAGHGANASLGGYLVTQDHEEHDTGINMIELITMANMSSARERVIILDCCHAGLVDELLATQSKVPLEKGVAILAGCAGAEYAAEAGGHGLFTGLVLDALRGGAADVRGAVTLASVYAYLNEVLTGWDQQPCFHANLAKLTPIRYARCSVSDEKLRYLPTWFVSPTDEYPLNPSYEPDEEPRDPDHEQIFGVLQQFRAARLLEPVGTPHMYYAAKNRLSCRLTPLGQFYWRAAQAGTI
jgi:hypothetical protein